MIRISLFLLFVWVLAGTVASQNINLSQIASLEQVYGESVEDESPLPMNDLDMDFGYALYETTVNVEEPNPTLTLENVRDYATVYLDGKLQGYLKDNKKSMETQLSPGMHKISIFAENIGRITYGPEILDNSKGVYGNITLGSTELTNWKMTPLHIKECEVNNLTFAEGTSLTPCFHKGKVMVDDAAQETFLNVSGWGMGEVWINGHYIGAYWEENSETTLAIPSDVLRKGENSVVVFELKNNTQTLMTLTDKACFK